MTPGLSTDPIHHASSLMKRMWPSAFSVGYFGLRKYFQHLNEPQNSTPCVSSHLERMPPSLIHQNPYIYRNTSKYGFILAHVTPKIEEDSMPSPRHLFMKLLIRDRAYPLAQQRHILLNLVPHGCTLPGSFMPAHCIDLHESCPKPNICTQPTHSFNS